MKAGMPLNPAESAAEKARQRIFRCIDKRQSFLVEAGAGAGKTYSLVNALKHLIETQGQVLMRHNQRVACITFTNIASDEIKSRTDKHPVIQADTIHSFCWAAIRPFQSMLRRHLPNLPNWEERLTESGGLGDRSVDYNLGYPKVEEREVFLHHDDVLSLTVALLAEPKFRRLLADRYPVMLIDEYQDTDIEFAHAILTNLIDTNTGLLVGFFGDHWQKIYGNGCGRVENSKLEVIAKESNFRSAPAIVSVLNRMRPELQQAVKDPDAIGSADVYHTNDWRGTRQTGGHTRGDLPPEISHAYLEQLKVQLLGKGWDFSTDKTKILMLTHKVLASEQGYRQLADIFSRTESYIKKEDPHIAFFVDVVEPVSKAFEAGQYGAMFELLGERRPLITSIGDKRIWRSDLDRLIELRKVGNVGQVIDHLRNAKLRLPNAVQNREDLLDRGETENDRQRASLERLTALRALPYQQVTALANFISGHTPFETKHGVKGAEFENVLVVVGRGWNLYDFNQMLEFMDTRVPSDKQDSYERNRNLFYVACSRPKRRLALLFTQLLSDQAMTTLVRLFGNNGIHALPA